MGWARSLFLGNFQPDPEKHNLELDRLREASFARRRDTERMDHRLDDLRRENDELKACLAAVVRVLAAKQILTEADMRGVFAACEPTDD